MPFDWPGSVDMENVVSVGHEPVGNQHAMTAKINALGAHVSGARLLSQFNQFGNATLEVWREHVIRIVAEAVIAQGDVGRVVADLLAASTELFEPDVADSGLRKLFLQRFTVEMGQAARHGKGANVEQGLNGVGLQNCNEFIQRTGGVSDGVEGCHYFVSSRK